MKQFEAMAKTVEEAIEQGLQELGVSIGDVDVMVVEEGCKGLFGLFGSRPAKVRLTVKASEEDPLGDLLEEKKPAKAKKNPEKKAEKSAEKKAEKPEKKQEKKDEEPAAEIKPAPEKKKAKKPAEKKPQAENEAPAAKEEKAAEPKQKPEVRPMEKPEVTMIPAEELTGDSPAGIAHAFLMELTKLMGVDVTIDMGTDAEGNVYGYINGDTLGVLIGRRGETLDAVK